MHTMIETMWWSRENEFYDYRFDLGHNSVKIRMYGQMLSEQKILGIIVLEGWCNGIPAPDW